MAKVSFSLSFPNAEQLVRAANIIVARCAAAEVRVEFVESNSEAEIAQVRCKVSDTRPSDARKVAVMISDIEAAIKEKANPSTEFISE